LQPGRVSPRFAKISRKCPTWHGERNWSAMCHTGLWFSDAGAYQAQNCAGTVNSFLPKRKRLSGLALTPGALKSLRQVWRRDKMNCLKSFVADESGATAIEYGLIAAGISVAIVAAVGLVGGQLNTLFDTIKTDLTPK
jgi:pilus assembly protein Flp/PilA